MVSFKTTLYILEGRVILISAVISRSHQVVKLSMYRKGNNRGGLSLSRLCGNVLSSHDGL